MTAQAPEGPFDSWDQRLVIIGRVTPYALLVISTTLALGSDPHWGSGRITLGLVAAAVVLTGWWVDLHPAWGQRRRLMALYYAGFLVLGTVLIARSPWFAFYAFTGVLHALQMLHRFWRYAGI